VSLAAYYDESYPPSVWGGGVDPFIASLNPTSGSAAAGPILVTVTGTNFEAGSVIEINQVAVPTTFVSATTLTTSYDPTVAGPVVFTVRNPNEEESNSVTFTVGAVTADDVSGWTVDEVKDFVREHPELLSEITELERTGSARVTLLDWLQTLLDEEDEPDDEE
jgi:hypothetical protein